MKKLLLLFALLLPAAGFAQQYSIDWYTIDGGGGVSSNAQYVVSGTIGQPDAGGPMTGGSYSLTGGFWSLVGLVQTPGAPKLRIFTTSTNSVVIAWPTPSSGFVLQQNSDIATQNWGGVTNNIITNTAASENQVILFYPAGRQFYRLVGP